ncbi:centrosomal protein kizuna isoform X1 [Conger conger]|uniref:centrosomal protein kizuna isoform X1 n=3 Tax=Conger conger TaxID=82655 RepID=UPI002A5A23BC|nr:centrosomal protein kizuna isoform X1 [Conger conger]
MLPEEAVLMTTSVNTHPRPRSRSPAMAFCHKEYFEKIGDLQQNMYKSEKRRFQLEKELLAFCTSGKQGSEIKNAKLRCYLKQISERENRAKARNLELLRHMESIELQMKALCFNHSALHQKKGMVLQGPAASNCSSHHAEGLYQPTTIFMGRQTSRSPPVEAEGTRATSIQPFSTEPDGFSCPPEQLESGRLKNRQLSRKGTKGPPHLSDDSSAVADSPARPEDAGIVAGAPASLNSVSPGSRPLVGPEPFSTRTTTYGEETSPTVGVRQEGVRTPPAERVPGGVLDEGVTAGDGECTSRVSSPEFEESGGKRQDALDSESHSLLSLSAEKSVDLTLSSGSDLPLSTSEGKDLAGFQEDSALSSARSLKTSRPGSSTERGDKPTTAADYHHTNAGAGSKDMEESEDGRESRHGKMASTSKAFAPILSLEGFFHLLESIEERLDEREKKVYRISTVSEQHLSYLISLCNGKAGLNEEDLEACGAVALHQLQRLSWNTSKGCLLPQDIVSANWTVAAEESRIRSCLPADGAELWEGWFRHALALRDRDAFTIDGIAKLFAPLLVEEGASYTDEAEALLSVLLEEPIIDSDESSGGLPSCLFDGGKIKAARPVGCRETFTDGQQSGEEDSQEESFVESIPIRETKAYQLLKQSAAQHRPQSPQEDEDEDGLDVFPSGVTHDSHVEKAGKGELARTSSTLFSERRLVGAGKVAKSTVPAVQSKAFWGESDDSNSDIEAALRPQSRGTAVDDFDYYD